MKFDRMTAQEAAECITSTYACGTARDNLVAAACEHFYERGIVDGRNVRDEEAARIVRDAASSIKARDEEIYERGREDAIAYYALRAMDPQSDVADFMVAFKQPMPDTPQWPDQENMDLRVRLKAEEFCEWLRDSGYEYIGRIMRSETSPSGEVGYQVYGFEHGESSPRNLPKCADALVDDLYVTFGALLAMGIDVWPLWRAVHRANMAKVGGPVVNGKQMKPEGWTPPDIDALLREQGWEGEDAAT